MEPVLELLRSMEKALGVKLGDDMSVLVITTSLALIVGLLVFVWKRSSGNGGKEARQVVVPKMVPLKDEEEEDVGPDKVKVTVFFGTQTGTAEGFAKVCAGHQKHADFCCLICEFSGFQIITRLLSLVNLIPILVK